jgi:hypothetical protein
MGAVSALAFICGPGVGLAAKALKRILVSVGTETRQAGHVTQKITGRIIFSLFL